MADKVPLKIAVATYPFTAAVKNGSIPIEGVDPEFVTVEPQIAAFRRMVRNVEFDVCELAPTTYLMARGLGAPYVGVPFFFMRAFHHGGLLVRSDSGIRAPKDLEGKKVGVRAYSVTTGVWTRGILIDEYDLDTSKVTWVVDDEEHVTQLQLPPNVVHAPEGHSLASMMREGELQAGFKGNAGIGREGKPTDGWKAAAPSADADYPDLFPNAAELEAEWYGRTGIYPVHGTLVVKDSVLKEHPWVARSLFNAFETAKAAWLPSMLSGADDSAVGKKYRGLAKIVGDDPLPNGLQRNLPTIKALESYGFKQGLIKERLPIERLFVDPAAA